MIDAESMRKGMEGEEIIRNELKKRNIRFFQADLMFNTRGNWYIAEVKHQERYTPPPFEGHGLPEWQIKARVSFQKATGIIALFFVVEIPTGIIYYNTFEKLESGERYHTKGEKKRIIYPLKNFIILMPHDKTMDISK